MALIPFPVQHQRSLARRHPPVEKISIHREFNCGGENFEKEWKDLIRLQHPNIVYYYAWNEELNDSMLALSLESEYCERKSLSAVIHDPTIIYSMKTVLCWAEHIFAALKFLAENQMAHRNVNPQNLLVTKDFIIKLSDYGCVYDVLSVKGISFHLTRPYVCPEIFAKWAANNKELPTFNADVYSAGVVLWEIIERSGVYDWEQMRPHNYKFWERALKKYGYKINPNSYLTRPRCFHPISGLVPWCTQRQLDDRPQINRIHALSIKLNRRYKKYEFEPSFRDLEDLSVIRPIGCDDPDDAALVLLEPEESPNQQDEVGRGSYGCVRLLEDRHPPIAAKSILRMWREDSIQKISFDNKELFEKEWKTLKGLPHPNIVHFYASKEVNQYFVIEMEYCERKSLREVLKDPRIIYNMKTVLCWAEHLMAALKCLADNGIVHRDIKPENVLVTKHFILKLGDFGCVRELSSSRDEDRAGTARYMSPEAYGIYGEIIENFQSDLYAVGLVLWEIIERRLVFMEYGVPNFSSFLKKCKGQKLKLDPPECDHSLKEIIQNCTQMRFEERPEIHKLYPKIVETNWKYQQFGFEPKIRDEQGTLLRPIGFDGTESETPIRGFEKHSENSTITPQDISSFSL